MQLITRELETPFGMMRFEQRPSDGYVFITPMFKQAGKEVYQWHRLVETQEYLRAFVLRNPQVEPVDIKRGGNKAQQGAWAHPRVALRAAQWIHADLAVIVDEIVEYWYTEGGKYQQAVLDTINMYVLPMPGLWEKRFPEEFMFHIYRLWEKSDEWERGKTRHAPWVGRAIDEIIYKRHFPEDVMREIRRQNPIRAGKGSGRKRKHMQHMTQMGDDNLKPAVYLAISVMQRAKDKAHLFRMLDIIAPKDRNQLLLPIGELI